MSQPIRIDTKPTAAQAQAVIDAGPGSTVYHPWARGGRRKQLEQALGRAGVPHRLVRSLGWTTQGPAAPPAQEPADAVDTLVDGDSGSDSSSTSWS